MKRLKQDTESVKANISTQTPVEVHTRFFDTQAIISAERAIHENERKTSLKLQRLISRTAEQWDPVPTLNEKSILNATQIQLPQ